MGHWTIFNQDVIEWAKSYRGEKFHALLCDPPYSLNFMNKSWDDGVATNPETWSALSEHLYDGAFIMVYGGSRTFHRVAVAIEDAGFVIHPVMSMLWIQGQGFPKATRIDGQIDKEAGAEQQKSGIKHIRNVKPYDDDNGWNANDTVGDFEYTLPSTDLAKAWAGHRYGLQALKPSVEYIIVAQKPYKGRPISNITETGAGALNIDGGRIGVNPDVDDMLREVDRKPRESQTWEQGSGFKNETNHLTSVPSSGRWPSNLVLCHTPECKYVGKKSIKIQSGKASGETFGKMGTRGIFNGANGSDDLEPKYYADENGNESVDEWECVEGCPVKVMDEQSGVGKSNGHFPSKVNMVGHTLYEGGFKDFEQEDVKLQDTGGASRFFFQADWSYEIEEHINNATPFLYTAKAGRSERDAGLDDMPMEHAPHGNYEGRDLNNPKNHLGGLQGTYNRNHHPTVKPISMSKYLATLLLPPERYAPRRILNAFSGSGSEAIGAILAGWEEVVCIEKDTAEGYVDISDKRLKWWATQALETEESEPSEILKASRKPNKPKKAKYKQTSLF